MVAPVQTSRGEPPTCRHTSDARLQADWISPPNSHRLLLPKSTKASPAGCVADQQLSRPSQPVAVPSLAARSTWGTRLSRPTPLTTPQHDTGRGVGKDFLGKRCVLDHRWKQEHIPSATMNRKLCQGHHSYQIPEAFWLS